MTLPAFPSDPIIPETPMPNAVTPQTTGTSAGDEAMPDVCPLCRTKPEFYSSTDMIDKFDHGFTIECTACGIEMSDEYRWEVVRRWNTRPVSAATPPAADVTGEAGEPFAFICAGCHSSWDDERLKAEIARNPVIISCCPERKMVPVYRHPATRPAASNNGGGAEVERLRAENIALLRRAVNAETDEECNREFLRVSDMRWAEEKAARETAEAALASMTAERDRLRKAFAEGFITATSGSGEKPFIKATFTDLASMQAAHNALIAALATPQADAGDRG